MMKLKINMWTGILDIVNCVLFAVSWFVIFGTAFSDARFVGVTGTNGKTTTTTMISLMLNQGQTEGKAYVAGNIGVPASQVAQEATNKDTIVTELSSFQLLGITEYHPKVAVLTNIYEAHIDYHGTRENYVNAKMRIVMNQTEDVAKQIGVEESTKLPDQK